MKQQAYFLVLLLAVFSFKIYAQETNRINNEIVERIAESYAENFDETTDLTPLIEDLERIAEKPININNATREELEQLQFLSTFQIENLLIYRKQFGQLYSIYEIENIEGFNSQQANDLSAFIVFLDPNIESKSYLNQELNFRYNQNIEKVAGLITDDNGIKAYSGIPPKLLLKYRAEKGNKLKFGITAENDSGEDFFTGTNPYGFDFYSGYFGFTTKTILKEVCLGDFQVKIGQGLIQWSGYGKRKSVEAVNVRSTGQGIKPYTSTDENTYHRGIASRIEFNNFNLITYYSNSKVDANIVESDSSGNPTIISSIQTSGYHRTKSEQIDKDAIRSQTAGASLKYAVNRFSVSLNGAFKKHNALLLPNLQNYSKFNFSGESNYNLSSDFLWVFNRINFFGEAAYSKSGGTAILTGFESQPANEVSLSFTFRNYTKDFQSVNGTSFAESSTNQNEKGIYTGITVFPFSHFKFSGYIDMYESYWLKYNNNGPVKGTDIIFQSTYTPIRKLEMYLRFKTENNSEKSSIELPIKKDENQNVSQLRFNLNWSASEIFSFRFRTEWSGYNKGEKNETGMLIFADIISQPIEKIKAFARLAWFNTDGYDSRIYTYENDVPQYFYIPVFYSKGLRYYLNFSFEITESLKLYCKVAQTRYLADDFVIGSGNTFITGNKRTDVKLQLKYRF